MTVTVFCKTPHAGAYSELLLGMCIMLCVVQLHALLSILYVQVVYEGQPRPGISLYVAPLGGQAADAVLTMNAQAGKHKT